MQKIYFQTKKLINPSNINLTVKISTLLAVVKGNSKINWEIQNILVEMPSVNSSSQALICQPTTKTQANNLRASQIKPCFNQAKVELVS